MKNRNQSSKQVGKVKTTTLVISLIVGFAFSIVMGVTGVAMGFGSLYPQINLIAKPIVCPSGQMTYTKQTSQIGTATYYTARWYCTNEASGEKAEIDPDTIFLCVGPIYGLVIFGILLLITYFYWNSSIGPAKNGGPKLW